MHINRYLVKKEGNKQTQKKNKDKIKEIKKDIKGKYL
jgi:hypothetical protein